MTTECKVMQELHAIREKIYEETKHMTDEERTEFFNKNAENALLKLGITPRYAKETCVHTYKDA